MALAGPLVSWAGERIAEWRTRVQSGDDNALLILAPLLLAVMLGLAFGEFLHFSLWESATRGLTPGKYRCVCAS